MPLSKRIERTIAADLRRIEKRRGWGNPAAQDRNAGPVTRRFAPCGYVFPENGVTCGADRELHHPERLGYVSGHEYTPGS